MTRRKAQKQLSGAQRIAAERKRQVKREGWTAEHDDEHDDGTLAMAAACYAAPEPIYVQCEYAGGLAYVDPWPDDWDDNRPCLDTATDAERIRALEKAGALCAAEIDRLLRRRTWKHIEP